jgi:hypothetical protein
VMTTLIAPALQIMARHTFSKVLCIAPLFSTCTRALTFQNLCQCPACRAQHGG